MTDRTWPRAELPVRLRHIPVFTTDLNTDPYRINPEKVVRLSDVLDLLSDLRNKIIEKRDWDSTPAETGAYDHVLYLLKDHQ